MKNPTKSAKNHRYFSWKCALCLLFKTIRCILPCCNSTLLVARLKEGYVQEMESKFLKWFDFHHFDFQLADTLIHFSNVCFLRLNDTNFSLLRESHPRNVQREWNMANRGKSHAFWAKKSQIPRSLRETRAETRAETRPRFIALARGDRNIGSSDIGSSLDWVINVNRKKGRYPRVGIGKV